MDSSKHRHRRGSGSGGVVIDQDFLEPSLVVVAAAGFVAEGIDAPAVLREIEHRCQRGLMVARGYGEPAQGSFRCQQLASEMLLLLARDVCRDRADGDWLYAAEGDSWPKVGTVLDAIRHALR